MIDSPKKEVSRNDATTLRRNERQSPDKDKDHKSGFSMILPMILRRVVASSRETLFP
jgi:hypothetical protein